MNFFYFITRFLSDPVTEPSLPCQLTNECQHGGVYLWHLCKSFWEKSIRLSRHAEKINTRSLGLTYKVHISEGLTHRVGAVLGYHRPHQGGPQETEIIVETTKRQIDCNTFFFFLTKQCSCFLIRAAKLGNFVGSAPLELGPQLLGRCVPFYKARRVRVFAQVHRVEGTQCRRK